MKTLSGSKLMNCPFIAREVVLEEFYPNWTSTIGRRGSNVNHDWASVTVVDIYQFRPSGCWSKGLPWVHNQISTLGAKVVPFKGDGVSSAD